MKKIILTMFLGASLLSTAFQVVLAQETYDYNYGGNTYDYNYDGAASIGNTYDYNYGGNTYDYNYGGTGSTGNTYDYNYGGTGSTGNTYDYNYGGTGSTGNTYDYNYGGTGSTGNTYDYNYGGTGTTYDYNYVGGYTGTTYDYNYTGGYTSSAYTTSPVYSNGGYSYSSYGTSPSYNYSTYSNVGTTYTTVPGQVVTTIVCPTGTLVNGQCRNTVTGDIVTVTTCPAGTSLSGNSCINTVNGVVVTNINCPTGTTLTNGQCVNNVNGPVITNVNCPTGTTLTNGQCVNTVTPPVTTVTNCPSNTQYINGTCQQIINPPVVVYQSCWDGSRIPATSVCPQQFKICPNGTSIPVGQTCYVTPTPVYVPPTVVKFNNVVTSVATQITQTSGRCNGIGLIANNAQSTAWFEYGETVNLGRTTASAAIGSSNTAPFSNVLANLKPSTKYYCRAVMQNQYGVVKGEIVSFVTKAKPVTYVKPVVTKTVTTTTKVPVKNEVTCVDGSKVTVGSKSAASLINDGQKLITLSIEKTDGKLISEGTVKYKITYKNLSDARVTGVLFRVALPVELKLMSANVGSYDEATRVLTLNLDGIDAYGEGSILLTAVLAKDAPLGKTIVTNVYTLYTVPGTQTQDEVTAYVIGSVVAASTTELTKEDTGVKNVVGAGNGKGFMPNSLIEWLALLAILFIIFILGRSIYASYKDTSHEGHH